MSLQLRKRLHGGKEDNGEQMSITGWALLFHPDLLHGFPIERHIGIYSFFDYRVNEALHMTDEEHDIMVSGIRQATNVAVNVRPPSTVSLILLFSISAFI